MKLRSPPDAAGCCAVGLAFLCSLAQAEPRETAASAPANAGAASVAQAGADKVAAPRRLDVTFKLEPSDGASSSVAKGWLVLADAEPPESVQLGVAVGLWFRDSTKHTLTLMTPTGKCRLPVDQARLNESKATVLVSSRANPPSCAFAPLVP